MQKNAFKVGGPFAGRPSPQRCICGEKVNSNMFSALDSVVDNACVLNAADLELTIRKFMSSRTRLKASAGEMLA